MTAPDLNLSLALRLPLASPCGRPVAPWPWSDHGLRPGSSWTRHTLEWWRSSNDWRHVMGRSPPLGGRPIDWPCSCLPAARLRVDPEPGANGTAAAPTMPWLLRYLPAIRRPAYGLASLPIGIPLDPLMQVFAGRRLHFAVQAGPRSGRPASRRSMAPGHRPGWMD